MTSDTVRDKMRLGFLTTVQTPEGSFVGGLLVTNHMGRPLEFQCTTPIKPNATQQILYGPTLKPFLMGELISKTLVERVGIAPDILLTEQEEVLELRPHVNVPVGLISLPARVKKAIADKSGSIGENSVTSDAAEASSEGNISSPAQSSEGAPSEKQVRLGRQWLRFHASHDDDRVKVSESSKSISADADLLEPFERVREALMEASRNGAGR
ncbi:MAG: hypothetical protein O2955_00645 [Planctomycetota bacterium]|nr:hypothetical protein [Planctomycetota bacterium]MDA1210989.1 hypothetical protein [Planctomycetota bacterium]